MIPSRNIPLVQRSISSVIRDWNLPASLAVQVDHLFLEKNKKKTKKVAKEFTEKEQKALQNAPEEDK